MLLKRGLRKRFWKVAPSKATTSRKRNRTRLCYLVSTPDAKVGCLVKGGGLRKRKKRQGVRKRDLRGTQKKKWAKPGHEI